MTSLAKNFSKLVQYFCFTILGIAFIINTLHLFKQDLLYHTDVARDFLIMQDIVKTQKLPLIGPRSGVGGIFHGPAWYYLNLPIFALSQGNPIAMGAYWWLIFWSSLTVFYFITKKIFTQDVSLLATTFYAATTIFTPMGLSNWHPALFLTIICVYYIWLYLTHSKSIHLALGLFFIGMVIQFEMAFGVPLLFSAGYVVQQIFKKRHYQHLLAFLVLGIPLSTFLLFDLRHDWLQVRSALAFFAQSGSSEFRFWDYLFSRYQAFVDAFSLLKTSSLAIRSVAAALSIVAFFLAKPYTYPKPKWRTFWQYSLLILFGFWLVTLPYQGNVWEFYYRSLLPLICLWMAFFVLKARNTFFTLLAMAVIAINIFQGLQSGLEYWQSPIDRHQVYWRFYALLANDIFKDAGGEFGFYVFTTDQYGYQAKYALQYFGNRFQTPIHENTKLPVTYLIIGPNDRRNPWADENFWRREQVRIDRPADEIRTYQTGYTVEKYLLSEEEIKIPSDPNLITGTYFR